MSEPLHGTRPPSVQGVQGRYCLKEAKLQASIEHTFNPSPRKTERGEGRREEGRSRGEIYIERTHDGMSMVTFIRVCDHQLWQHAQDPHSIKPDRIPSHRRRCSAEELRLMRLGESIFFVGVASKKPSMVRHSHTCFQGSVDSMSFFCCC